MDKIFPEKLKAGDEIRVIAPARSLAIISTNLREIAKNRFAELGLKLSFGKHVEEIDDFASSSIKSRVEDLQDAFSDINVKAVLTVIGGFNSNQLLQYIDWDLIKNNPKIFCGLSDITALNNAILTKTGIVTYSTPNYSDFGQKLYFDYTLNYFKRCLFSEEPFEITPSDGWSDDEWFKNQDNRDLIPNSGYFVVNRGKAEGTVLGTNLCTLNLLQGTEYFPDLTDSILFLEDDEESKPHTFDRDLQSLIHLPGFLKVKGIVIGRFQKNSDMTDNFLTEILRSKKELDKLPILANVNFGHTNPKISLPIGGKCILDVKNDTQSLLIIRH